MRPQFASFRPQIGSPNAIAAAGGTTTTAFNYTYFLQLENRAGRNLLSTGVAVPTIAGEKITWTFSASEIESGEEAFYYVLSASPDGTEANAAIVGKIKARDDDQQTVRTLPLVLELTEDDHFTLNGIVADLPSLPSNPVEGQIRFVTSENKYYFYDSEAILSSGQILSYGVVVNGEPATVGYWVETPNSAIAIVPDTTATSDIRLRDGTDALQVPAKIDTTPTEPFRIWLLNGLIPDGGSLVPEGTRYSLQIKVSGVDLSTLFSSLVELTRIGEVERATGIIDTGITGASETIIWDPGENSFIDITEDLDRGFAIAFDVVFNFDNDLFESIIPDDALISLDFFQISNIQSNVNIIASAIGDVVFSNPDQLLVVPDIMLGGVASVEPVYIIQSNTEQSLAGLLTIDTADQVVTINGPLNGVANVYPDIPSVGMNERVRAIVSTVPGICQLVYAGQLVVAPNDAIELDVTHPINPTTLRGTIRSNYPDPLIADNDQGFFTPTLGSIIVDNGSVFQSPNVAISFTGFDTYVIDDLTGYNGLGGLPTPNADFGLFEVDSAGLTLDVGGGSLAAGTYDIYFAYIYVTPNNNLTVIDHTAPPAIGTATNSFAETLSLSLIKTNNLDDLSDLAIAKVNIELGDFLEFADIPARDAATPKKNDIAYVADDGNNNPIVFAWNGSAWIQFPRGNAVFDGLADIAARDALTGVLEGDIAKVANDGTGNARDYIWNGSAWIDLVQAGFDKALNGLLEEALHYYNFDEASGVRVDTIGSLNLNEIGGTINANSNGIRNDQAVVTSGLYFEANAAFTTPSGSFSLSAWITPASDTSDQIYIGQWGTAGNRSFYLGFVNATDTFIFAVSDDGTNILSVEIVTSPTQFQLYHLVATYNAATGGLKLYQDGVATTASSGITGSIFSSGSDLTVGAGDSGINPAEVRIDETVIYDRLLSDRDVELLYNDSMGFFLADFSNELTTDEKVRVSPTDLERGFLEEKIVSGTNITINKLNSGADEQLEIVSTAAGTDELAKVTSNDTTADFLLNKIVAGTNITINELNDGGNETLEIVAAGGGGGSGQTTSESSSGVDVTLTPGVSDNVQYIAPTTNINVIILTAGATNETWFEIINDAPLVGTLSIKIDLVGNPTLVTLDNNVKNVKADYTGTSYKFH